MNLVRNPCVQKKCNRARGHSFSSVLDSFTRSYHSHLHETMETGRAESRATEVRLLGNILKHKVRSATSSAKEWSAAEEEVVQTIAYLKDHFHWARVGEVLRNAADIADTEETMAWSNFKEQKERIRERIASAQRRRGPAGGQR